MEISINLLVILSGIILLQNCSPVVGENLTCKKEGIQYVVVLCKPSASSSGNFTLSDSDTINDVQFLTIKVNDVNSTLLITQPDMFKKLPYMNTLHINTSENWLISDSSSLATWKDELFAVPSLEILRITYLNYFNDRVHMWKLTENLKQLYLENSLMDFDLTTCDNLYSLSLINASLKNIPNHKGLNFLGTLDLRKNALKEMTVLDIAGFCSLEELNIMDAQIEDCECRKFAKLFSEMREHSISDIFHVRYRCNHNSTKTCPHFNWTAVRKKRDSCTIRVTSSLFRQVAIIIGIIAAAMTVSICVGAFCIWYLNKRE